MSGKADSKQISTPIVSGWPFGVVVTVSVCAPVPGIMLLDAALLMLGQPAELLAERDVLAERHQPRLHVAALDARRADQHRDLLLAAAVCRCRRWAGLGPGRESWLARISAWSWADSCSICREQGRGRASGRRRRSTRPRRSGRDVGREPAVALNSAVSASEASTRWVGSSHDARLDEGDRDLAGRRGTAAVRANASGPEPAATANAATPSAPRAIAAAGRGCCAASGGAGGGRGGVCWRGWCCRRVGGGGCRAGRAGPGGARRAPAAARRWRAAGRR